MHGKTYTVVADIKSKIDKGVLTHGSKLPSTYDIARSYGVAYPTAHKAIQKLAQEGYVYRKQGEGTFVSKSNSLQTKQVGIIVRTDGHLFGEFAHHLLSELQNTGYHSRVIPIGEPHKELSMSARSAIEKLINSNPSAIITEAQNNKEFLELMKKAESSGIKIIWILCSEPPVGLGGNVVGSDMFSGYYKIAEHLIKLGHKRIAVFAIHLLFEPIDPFARALEQIKNNYPYVEFIPLQADSDYEQEDNEITDRIKSMLQAGQRPSAFLCSLDFRAKIVIEIARQLGIRVPEDLAVTGFFNTPWAESYDITTVDIHPDKIAFGIVDMLEKFQSEDSTDGQTSWRILIEPTLIVRSSTGRKDLKIDD